MVSENPYSSSPTGAGESVSRVRRNMALPVTVGVAVGGFVMLSLLMATYSAALLFWAVSFFPLAVTAGLSLVLRSPHSQTVLMISSAAYACWFLSIFVNAVYINPDPQSPLAFLVVGVYALPVLALFWGAAGVIHWRSSHQTASHNNAPELN